MIFCSRCGNVLTGLEETCPNCGCQVNGNAPQQVKVSKWKKCRNVIVTVLLFALPLLYGNLNGCLRAGAEYYDVKDEIVEVINENMNEVDSCNQLLYDVCVYHILEMPNPETDPYTYEDGEFIEDFDEVLERLYMDEDYAKSMEKIEEQNQQLIQLNEELPEAPLGSKKSKECLIRLNNNWIAWSSFLLEPEGSADEVMTKLSEFRSEAVELQKEWNEL